MTPRLIKHPYALALTVLLTACGGPSTHLRSSAGEAAVRPTDPKQELVIADSVSYTFGPAAPRDGLTAEQARRRALEAWQDGQEALHVRLYDLAEKKFREAVLFDGADARYHGALGGILLRRGKRIEAEAALSAAVLLDMENANYRKLLLEARRRD